MPGLESPVCDTCGLTFNQMELLNIHMKTIHNETPHLRITRLTQTIENALREERTPKISIIFDCSECGNVFETKTEMDDHNIRVHRKIESQGEIKKEKEGNKPQDKTANTQVKEVKFADNEVKILEERLEEDIFF